MAGSCGAFQAFLGLWFLFERDEEPLEGPVTNLLAGHPGYWVMTQLQRAWQEQGER